MKYENFSVDQFLKDESFCQWVLYPESDSDQFWTKWIQEHPQQKLNVELAIKLIKNVNYKTNFSLDPATRTMMFENIMRHKRRTEQFKDRKSAKLSIWWYSAAAIFVLFLSTVFFLNSKKEPVLTEQPIEWILKEVPEGAKMTITLPDGSLVKLNAESSIRYPSVFNSQQREVHLTGEAFFNVTKDSLNPFTIYSGSLVTKVLGTSFNVKAYDQEQLKVAVVTGLVEVTTEDGKSSLLHPNKMIVYSKESKEMQLLPFNSKEELGWKDGILFFEKVPLKKVFSTLESWYGVKIKVKGALSLEEPYSGEFDNENLENVLTGIGFTSGFTYSITKDQVEIYKSNKSITM